MTEGYKINKKISFIEEFFKKRNECLKEGHKDILWMPFNDGKKVEGICKYCHGDVKRYLNEKELGAKKRFYEIIKEPFII